MSGVALVNSSPVIGVVDDDPDVLGSLDSLLRSAGLAARCFAGGALLLASEDWRSLACIVTDLHMPGMTGLELLLALREEGADLPVIMVTAYPTEAVRRQAEEAGCIAFLTKPVDPDMLLEAIALAIA
ncbi:MAG TPA: response regulator [Sphingomonadaceae bacterium]|nr:response regulator [Sphingomonadaceae bacterium]